MDIYINFYVECNQYLGTVETTDKYEKDLDVVIFSKADFPCEL